MKGKKKGVLLLLMLLSVFMLLPMGVSAAKLNMATPLKYSDKRLQESLPGTSPTPAGPTFTSRRSFKNGTYGSLEKGGGIVVNMS